MAGDDVSTPRRGRDIAARVDGLSDRRFFLLALGPLLAVYLATASWTTVKSPDPMTNAITAWNLAHSGTVVLDEHRGLEQYSGGPTWIVYGEHGPVSQYPPGAALLAAPLYAVWPGEAEVWKAGDPRRWEDAPVDVLVPPLAPAALVAAVTAALAVAIIGLAARPLIGGVAALAAVYVYGLGTGAWAVAADALWQHGPGMLWVSLGVWLAYKQRHWGAGLAFGLAVLTRPPLALIAAAVGIAAGWSARSWRPVGKVAAGSVAGLAAVIGYNAWAFGSPSISGGYGGGFASSAADTDLAWYVKNVFGGLFDPTRGLLALSPFIALLALGVVAGRSRKAPAAFVGAALGGALYLLVQWKANRFSGGSNFVGYRYPLEPLTAGAPLLSTGWTWVRERQLARQVLLVAVAYSVALYVSFVL